MRPSIPSERLATMCTRIIIADDHPVVRLGVRALLERQGRFDVVGEADNPDQLMRMIECTPTDLLLTDFAMPSGPVVDGQAMLAMIRRRHPGLPIVLLTTLANIPSLRIALQAGVRGVIDKCEPMERIPDALDEVLGGAVHLGSRLREALQVDRQQSTSASPQVSPKELEVLRLYVSGASISQIATRLDRTVSTISRQRIMAMRKLGVCSEADLFTYAYEQGLATAPRPHVGAAG
jgi:two-component system capsular synthesis response regulator RcsB